MMVSDEMEKKEDQLILLQKKLEQCKTDKYRMKIISSLADYYGERQQYFLSKEWGEKLLALATSVNDRKMMVCAHDVLGKSYSELDMYDLAMKNMLASLQIARDTKDRKQIAATLNFIGVIYANMKDKEKAFHCFLEAIEYNDKHLYSLINLGVIYSKDGEFTKSLKCLRSAQIIAKQSKDNYDVIMSQVQIAYTFLRMKQFKKARKQFEQFIGKEDEIDDSFLSLKICVGISKSHIGEGDIDKAREFLQRAEKIAEGIAIKGVLKESYLLLSETYEEINDTVKAFFYYKMHTEINSAIFSDKLARNLAQVQDQFDREKKELEKAFQEKLNETEREMQERLESIQSLYAEVVGIKNIGIFSDVMENIYLLSEKLHQDRNIPVLIEGETGTGKEIIARVIHFGKEKSKAPIICINCSAISPSLFESELFGYEGGAYTGSKQQGMQGKLELANGGTLFLDEIGDMPLEMQPKLLRVLQEKMMYRIGGVKEIKLNVRIICATNQDLNALIEGGKFRRDLYYRLNTGHIKIPPLRERKEEIVPLAKLFLKYFAEQKKKKFKSISKDTEIMLESQIWRGNVRELESAIERAVMLFDDIELKPCHLLNEFSSCEKGWQSGNNLVIPLNEEKMLLADIETDIIKQLLKRFEGNKTKSAEYLGITRMTLRSKLKKK